MCRFGNGLHHAALPDQIAEHQKTDQRHRIGSHNTNDNGHHDGEQNFGSLGNGLALVLHFNLPLCLGGAELNHGRLDQRNQRHVGIGCHHDGTQVFAAQLRSHKNGCGAVCCTDDGDGCGIPQVIAQQGCQRQGEENTELGGSAEDHQLGICQQRLKIDHGTDADKQHQGEQLRPINTDGKQGIQHVLHSGSLHRHRQVYQDGTEAHGQQQSRLHLLCDGKIYQHTANAPHHQHLPGNVGKVLNQYFHDYPPKLKLPHPLYG